ncbi:MAG TPA: hypothetical protein EYP62_07310 [Kiritimatiellae bacterium]|nr:hypothetical protein [Kiritimatiellia bacterium]
MAVSEQIVREYFESLGFLVRQPTKYRVQARHKEAVEQIDLVVWNPSPARRSRAGRILWDSSDVRAVTRGIVSVHGWHSERITPAVLKFSPELAEVGEREVVRAAGRLVGKGAVSRIVCLSDLPASAQLSKKTLHMLREKGVDGVILFRTMLLELVGYVERDRIYDHSELLQLLRILKRYDLFREPQMDLFPVRRGRTSRCRRHEPGK